MKKIRFLIMDVDGTLTDGKIYMSGTGEMFKAFDVKDGYGIYAILRQCDIIPVIITGRTSEIVKNRCNELRIDMVYQGISDKRKKLDEILQAESLKDGVKYDYSQCAYIGDDIPDLEIMKVICENGGISAAPSDAVKEIIDISSFKCLKRAGEGAVRELIDFLSNHNNLLQE